MKISEKIKELLVKVQRVAFTENQIEEDKGYVTLQVSYHDDQFNLCFDRWEFVGGDHRHAGVLFPMAWSESLSDAIKELEVDLEDCELAEDDPSDVATFITVGHHTYKLVD